MGLLIAAALGVIVFLLVEGTKAKAPTSPQSPVTGAAGAPASQASASSDWLSSISEAGLGDPNADLGFGSPSDWVSGWTPTSGIEQPIGPVRPFGS